MALNLVVAAIILWNTAYLDRAIQVLNEEGISVPEEYLAHISPLGWEHITITGTYHWRCGSALGTFPIPPPRRRRVSKGRDRLAGYSCQVVRSGPVGQVRFIEQTFGLAA